MARMRKAGGNRIWAGAFLDDGGNSLPPPDALRAAFVSGDLRVMGEIAAQYHGLNPSDPWFEPYLALAEELDIPVWQRHRARRRRARLTAAVRS